MILTKYILDEKLTLIFQAPTGEKVEITLDSDTAERLGDDIFHSLYVGKDEEGRKIKRVTRSVNLEGLVSYEDGDTEFEEEE